MTGSDVSRIAVLGLDIRRRMYEFVRQCRTPVSRDDVAAAVGTSRKLAAFHLDKLVKAELLRAHYARPAGRGGPGAGRTSKLYQAPDADIQLTLPERRYDVGGEILLAALETRARRERARDAVERVAIEFGAGLAESARRDLKSRRRRVSRRVVRDVLNDYGFEPYTDAGGAMRLRNCPFLRLAQSSPEIVCPMNRALIDGLLRGLGDDNSTATLDPHPHECCVVLNLE